MIIINSIWGVLYNKREHMFLQNLVECSTNKHQINPNDNQGKTLINQAKFPPTLKIPFKIQKNHTIEINIVNLFINKTTFNQKAIKNEPL